MHKRSTGSGSRPVCLPMLNYIQGTMKKLVFEYSKPSDEKVVHVFLNYQ